MSWAMFSAAGSQITLSRSGLFHYNADEKKKSVPSWSRCLRGVWVFAPSLRGFGPGTLPPSHSRAEEVARRLQGPGVSERGCEWPCSVSAPRPGRGFSSPGPELPGWAPATRRPTRESAGCKIIVYLVFISLSGVYIQLTFISTFHIKSVSGLYFW